MTHAYPLDLLYLDYIRLQERLYPLSHNANNRFGVLPV